MCSQLGSVQPTFPGLLQHLKLNSQEPINANVRELHMLGEHYLIFASCVIRCLMEKLELPFDQLETVFIQLSSHEFCSE